jgi:hypothetical protein
MNLIFNTITKHKKMQDMKILFCNFQMLKIVSNFLQGLIVTEEVWVRMLRNALKLKMGMREAAQILIPVSFSHYHDLMSKAVK